MGLLTSNESRLIFALLLNALALWAAWRLAQRINVDPFAAAGDAGLMFYLVQYLSVCVPGVPGALHPVTLADGRIMFSSLENQGLRSTLHWSLWTIRADGSHWDPLVSDFGWGLPSSRSSW